MNMKTIESGGRAATPKMRPKTAIHGAVSKIHQCFGGDDPINALIREDASELYDIRLGLEPGLMSQAYGALREV